MDSTRIKIGQVLYGQSEGSEDIALVKVESVGVGGINYNDTDNTFQYSFDELSGIPVAANVLLSSGFTLSNGLYVNDNISFIKIKQINGQWFWYADRDKCIMVKYLHELQGLYGDLTGNTLAVDEDALLIALDSAMVLSAPTDFAASDTTPTTVTISWLEDAYAEGYEYQIDDEAWVEVDVAEAELTGLTYSTTYKIRVKAIGDGESFVDSPESEEYSFTTAALIVLDTPVVTASLIEEQSIDISWEAIANADGYQYKTGDGEWSATQTELTATIGLLSASTEYTFYVKAIGDGVVYDNSLAGSLTETTLDEKLTMGSITSEALGTTSVKFSWDEVANSVGYICQYKEGEGSFVDYVGEIADDEGVRSVTLTDLTLGTQYTFSVIADADTGYRDSDAAEGVVNTNAE